MLEELHETHPGVNRMKRSYIWWLHMDADIEELVRSCQICQQPSPAITSLHSWAWPEKSLYTLAHGQRNPATAPYPTPWTWPEKPWSRIHLDFVGPFCGHIYILVDKWLGVVMMKSIQLLSSSGLSLLLMVYCRKSSRTMDLLSRVTFSGALPPHFPPAELLMGRKPRSRLEVPSKFTD